MKLSPRKDLALAVVLAVPFFATPANAGQVKSGDTTGWNLHYGGSGPTFAGTSRPSGYVTVSVGSSYQSGTGSVSTSNDGGFACSFHTGNPLTSSGFQVC